MTEACQRSALLRLFSELPLDEVARLEALQGREVNEAKKVLADAVTTLCHGREAAKAARLREGVALADLMVAAGIAGSKGEARRLVRGGGARVNDSALDDDAARLTHGDTKDGVIKLSAGRRRHALIRVV